MFILKIIDHCTPFPEAIPLVVKHEAIDVAKAFVSAFCRHVFAHEILSDLGTEFL